MWTGDKRRALCNMNSSSIRRRSTALLTKTTKTVAMKTAVRSGGGGERMERMAFPSNMSNLPAVSKIPSPGEALDEALALQPKSVSEFVAVWTERISNLPECICTCGHLHSMEGNKCGGAITEDSSITDTAKNHNETISSSFEQPRMKTDVEDSKTEKPDVEASGAKETIRRPSPTSTLNTEDFFSPVNEEDTDEEPWVLTQDGRANELAKKYDRNEEPLQDSIPCELHAPASGLQDSLAEDAEIVSNDREDKSVLVKEFDASNVSRTGVCSPDQSAIHLDAYGNDTNAETAEAGSLLVQEVDGLNDGVTVGATSEQISVSSIDATGVDKECCNTNKISDSARELEVAKAIAATRKLSMTAVKILDPSALAAKRSLETRPAPAPVTFDAEATMIPVGKEYELLFANYDWAVNIDGQLQVVLQEMEKLEAEKTMAEREKKEAVEALETALNQRAKGIANLKMNKAAAADASGLQDSLAEDTEIVTKDREDKSVLVKEFDASKVSRTGVCSPDQSAIYLDANGNDTNAKTAEAESFLVQEVDGLNDGVNVGATSEQISVNIIDVTGVDKECCNANKISDSARELEVAKAIAATRELCMTAVKILDPSALAATKSLETRPVPKTLDAEATVIPVEKEYELFVAYYDWAVNIDGKLQVVLQEMEKLQAEKTMAEQEKKEAVEALETALNQRAKAIANLKMKKAAAAETDNRYNELKEQMEELQARTSSENAALRQGIQKLAGVRDTLKSKLRTQQEVIREVRAEREAMERKLAIAERQREMEKELLNNYRRLAQHTGYFKWGKQIRTLEADLASSLEENGYNN